MQLAARWLYLVALIVWVGEVVFFSFVVAPAVFRIFPPPAVEAGRILSAVFPIYYKVGYACGVVLLAASLIVASTAQARLWPGVGTVVVAGMLAATLYAGMVILPRTSELRPQIHDATAPAGVKEEFDRLHHLAVLLNGGVLLGGIALSVITAAGMRP